MNEKLTGHKNTAADHTDHAAAPTCGDSGVAQNFTAGAHHTNPTVEIKPGVFGEGFVKSG